MWHPTACKVSVSLSFLNWIKTKMIFYPISIKTEMIFYPVSELMLATLI